MAPTPTPAPEPATVVAPVQRAVGPAAPAKPSDRMPVPWPALGVAGGGVVLLIIGVSLGGAAVSASHSVQDASSTSNPLPFTADLLATEQKGKSLAAAGAAMDVLGVLAIGAGGAWAGYSYYKHTHKKDSIALYPLGAGLALGGTF